MISNKVECLSPPNRDMAFKAPLQRCYQLDYVATSKHTLL